jgi:PAS domain S-box-containing protein
LDSNVEQYENTNGSHVSLPEKEGLHAWIFATCWTIIIILSLSWNVSRQRNEMIEVATNEAKTIFEKDLVYYRWAASHNGVYVPISSTTNPNPYLQHLPESSAVTATGVPLTLVNPEYMIRQVYDMKTGPTSALGHITSLDPIRDENAADDWESEALDSFEDGETQVSSVEEIGGKPYLRLMRPMVTETGCLKCHIQQGYEMGDIRGGISVAVPLDVLFSIYRKDILVLVLAHFPLWIMVLVGIFFSSHRMSRSMQRREEAEAKTRAIINNMLDGLITMREDGIIESMNAPACQLFERKPSELLGKNITMLIQFPGVAGSPGEDGKIGLPDMSSMIGEQIELRGFRRDGATFPLEVSLSEMSHDVDRLFIITVRDVTEEKIRKSEALRTGQLAAIGELAAGVAHEINNPINGIINYTQIILDNAEDKYDDTDKDFMSRIIKEGERIALIVGNLLSFARQRDDVVEEVSIKEIIEDSVSLLMHQLQQDGINLVVDIPPDLPPIQGNPQQLQQVIVNLLTNASYALNQRYPETNKDKRLEIRCRQKTAMGREYVSTTVTDWGVGIPQNVIEHIFDSLFTTKPPGKGTGLGLSISKGLVRDHQGFLSVESCPGGPTVATVDLPVELRGDNQ